MNIKTIMFRSRDDGQFYVDPDEPERFERWSVNQLVEFNAQDLEGNNDLGELLMRTGQGNSEE